MGPISTFSSCSSLIIALATITAVSSQSCEEPDADVLILGAGISGIAAARTLYDSGTTNFIILEQASRIGGRMRSTQFAGATIELGAQYIFCADPDAPEEILNPAYRLAVQCGLRFRTRRMENFVGAAYTRQGEKITNSPELISAALRFFQAQASAINLGRQLEEEDPSGNRDYSVEVGLRNGGWQSRSAVERFIEFFFFDLVSGESMPSGEVSLRKASPLYIGSNLDFGPNPGVFLITDTRGFVHIVDCLAEDFLTIDSSRLHLNTTVTNVQWSDDCVCADAIENSVERRYCAPHAIITFSIGVLQHGIVTFDPPLPPTKVFAINHISMANFLKIWLAFNETFWDTDVDWIAYIDDREGHEYYPIFNSQLSNIIPDSLPIIQVFITGKTALRIAQQDIEITKRQMVEVLRRMYGSDNVPEPVDITMHDFITNRYFFGDFSGFPVGVNKQTTKRVAAPVGRLYFTGEAINLRHRGVVHGAYIVGVDTANAILRDIEEGKLYCLTQVLC